MVKFKICAAGKVYSDLREEVYNLSVVVDYDVPEVMGKIIGLERMEKREACEDCKWKEEPEEGVNLARHCVFCDFEYNGKWEPNEALEHMLKKGW